MSPARRPVIDSTVTQTLIGYGLPIVTLVMFVSAAGIPTGVPIVVVLLMAGAYLIGSLPWLLLAIVVVAAAELGGTVALHVVARTGGARLLDRLPDERQERLHAAFDRWRGRLGGRDLAAIAVLRLIPFVRMGTTVGAGLLGIRLRDFVLGSAVAAVVWTGVPLSLGFAFRTQLEMLEGYYEHTTGALPALLGGLTLALAVGVLVRSAATRARLRDWLAPIWPPFRSRSASLPLSEISQKTPPAVN